ncbi:GntR family transcriptional regulator [Nonomuraea sp. NPDC050310]|uniref:GntR family transcriptional regulator n=1 Tax=Nonomuraea sp. NPDC050310 TaxID=3154935 RepID=UPI0033D62A7B
MSFRCRTGRLSDQVYDRLRQAVIDGDLTPNTRLVGSELARQYGISQAPVRDAIRRLAHEGLVTLYRFKTGTLGLNWCSFWTG